LADFLNPFFADPAATGIPGEAEDWTWASVSAAGEWADFNTAVATQAYQLSREGFEAGFSLAWDKSYANETARLTDGTLVPADIGVIARQEDTKDLYALISDSPVSWQLVPSNNEDWVSSLLSAGVIAAVFNGASSTFEATIESFNVWGELTWPVPGPPWIESPALIRQDSGEGLSSPYELGFKGWYGTAMLSNDLLLSEESFEEGFENDPMSASLVQWQPGTAPGGVMRGLSLVFPLTVLPGKTKFFIWHPTLDAFYRVVITPGEYATASALSAELQSKWAALVSPFATGLEWGTWVDDDGNTGLTFGHNGNVFNETAMFGAHEDEVGEDARSALGISGLGPNGTGPSRLLFQADYVSNYPSDVQHDAHILFDRWTFIDFIVEWDPVLLFNVVEYSQIGALFNTFSTGPNTKLETFFLEDWFGAGATWKTSPTPSTEAIFVGGELLGTIESFEDPTVNWPDNLYEE